MKTDKELEELARQREAEIISAWWEVDIWEFAEEHELSDEEMLKLLEM